MKNIHNRIIAMVVAASTLLFSCSDDNEETEALESQFYDLGIGLVQHADDEIITNGNIQFAFEVTNHGSETVPAGSVLYASARIDGVLFSFDLLSSDPTEITLEEDLVSGGVLNYDPGYLEGVSTLAFYEKTAVDFCIVLWGVGEASVDDMSAYDADITNNEVCVTYAQYDFETTLTNYESNTVLTEGGIELAFDVANHSEVTFPAGTELMVSARIGGVLFSLDLLGSDPSAVTIDEDWAPSGTFSYNPGPLDGAATLAFLELTEGDFCIIVWGIGESSVGDDFPDDLDGSDNEACVTFSSN